MSEATSSLWGSTCLISCENLISWKHFQKMLWTEMPVYINYECTFAKVGEIDCMCYLDRRCMWNIQPLHMWFKQLIRFHSEGPCRRCHSICCSIHWSSSIRSDCPGGYSWFCVRLQRILQHWTKKIILTNNSIISHLNLLNKKYNASQNSYPQSMTTWSIRVTTPPCILPSCPA